MGAGLTGHAQPPRSLGGTDTHAQGWAGRGVLWQRYKRHKTVCLAAPRPRNPHHQQKARGEVLPPHTHTPHTMNVTNRHYKGAECKDSRQTDATVKEEA